VNFLSHYGPRIKKFALCPPEKDSRINILEGSVRSGKTWALHTKLLYGCGYPVAGWRMIFGQSKDTIYTNVLHDFFNLIGSTNYRYNHQSGFLQLMGTDWKVMGAKDEGSERFLRGATVGYAIGDELTLVPKSFFQMMLTRMSPAGARLYGTTNTDSPFHWLKTDYLDDRKSRREQLVFSMHCTMEDNPNLPREYIESQKSLYKGLFYQRFILGEWVLAEGGIYRDCWDDSLLFDDASTPPGLYNSYKDRWISVDCGVDHPQVYLDWYDDGETVWIANQYRWDSRVEMRQKTDGQYADDLEKFMNTEIRQRPGEPDLLIESSNRGCEIILPPECASFEAELVLRGLWVNIADNEVSEGIKTLSSLMARRKIRIHRTRCASLINQIQTYSWDPKASLRGEEKPLKQSAGLSVDDDCDCARYGAHGKIPIWRYAA
jgi:PBSX family phage terminase large subunit